MLSEASNAMNTFGESAGSQCGECLLTTTAQLQKLKGFGMVCDARLSESKFGVFEEYNKIDERKLNGGSTSFEKPWSDCNGLRRIHGQ